MTVDSLSNSVYTINNPTWTDAGTYTINLLLTSYSPTFNQSTDSFRIVVSQNTYPYFDTPPQSVLILPTSMTTYTFPVIKDSEGDPTSIIMTGIPSYASLNAATNVMTFNPSTLGSTIITY